MRLASNRHRVSPWRSRRLLNVGRAKVNLASKGYLEAFSHSQVPKQTLGVLCSRAKFSRCDQLA